MNSEINNTDSAPPIVEEEIKSSLVPISSTENLNLKVRMASVFFK